MTYAELLAQITAWSDRADLTTVAPTFIALAEERFNRVLRLNAFSTAATVTVLSGQSTVALPADFLEGRALTDGEGRDYEQVTPERLARMLAYGEEGRYFAIFGGSLRMSFVASADTALSLTYWQKVPALTVSNTTNWLSDNHPGVYLWAALAEAAIYTVSPQQGAVYENRAQQAIADLQASERAAAYFAGAITGDYVA